MKWPYCPPFVSPSFAPVAGAVRAGGHFQKHWVTSGLRVVQSHPERPWDQVQGVSRPVCRGPGQRSCDKAPSWVAMTLEGRPGLGGPVC